MFVKIILKLIEDKIDCFGNLCHVTVKWYSRETGKMMWLQQTASVSFTGRCTNDGGQTLQATAAYSVRE